uniref:NADH-ubiquinone oxidoreductase chain 5 n=1 Tax=Dinomachus sikhimensis TaxID=2813434 RepID=A0A8T9ZWU2_9HEMI|nr:NADH dehydrogenase subunit 5 [Dinomachus sikhimensis]
MFFVYNFYKFWSLIIFVSGILSYFLGLYFLFIDYSLFIDYNFVTLNSCSLVMTFLLDWMSLLFMGSVLFISSMVLFYSNFYMDSDFNSVRFLYLVLLFIFSMLFMIVSPNLISILLGWDGLGLVSYALVIYFQNFKSYNAGMLTVLTNRIGDVAILLGISWMFNNGSWSFIYYNFYFYNYSVFLYSLIVIAAFTKSAQIPFSSWLPAAMAAPTPVSALVHSSTLVTAGVYLLIRFYSLLTFFDLNIFLFLSMMTMFMSGLGANFEYDLKKIIALSTLSQLGLMMSILFMGFPLVAFFHLLSHAFFKALLFLCAGVIIHNMNDSQDIRYMGGLSFHMPYTSSCFCIANLSLCGLPFLSGFYSKDLVLETMTFSYYNFYVYLLFYISVGLTVSYSMRLLYYCMYDYNGLLSFYSYSESVGMLLSMLFLTFMGIFGGSFMSWLIFSIPDLNIFPVECKLMPLVFVLLGSFLGYELSIINIYDSVLGFNYSFCSYFLGCMWFMPNFSTYMFYFNGYYMSLYYSEFMDMGWGEYLISNSLPSFFNYLSLFFTVCQSAGIKLFFISFIFMLCFVIII